MDKIDPSIENASALSEPMYFSYNSFTEMGGNLELSEFLRYSAEAEALINTLSSNRIILHAQIENLPYLNKLNHLLFELISLSAEANKQVIASESSDGFSISYVNNNKDLAYFNNKRYALINSYLGSEVDSNGQPLLYRGGGK